MRICESPPIHLTYCLNVHPGQSWPENLAAIRTHALAVRDRLCPGRPFGLGMRLARQAAEELGQPPALEEFRRFLDDNGLYVFTINGFPYGPFHGTAVKEAVYEPDWQRVERRDYTNLLGDILCALLPPDVPGSISTVPCSYKAWVRSDEQVAAMSRTVADTAAHLASLAGRTGRNVVLALEPEPDCYVETTDEAVAFLTGPLRRHGVAHLTGRGIDAAAAETTLRRHVGLCLDTAHAAVEFESLPASLDRCRQAGVAVAKVQISSALSLRATPEALRQLEAFRDSVYLHQVKVRDAAGAVLSYRDLPEALAATTAPTTDAKRQATCRRDGVADAAAAAEWRVHFHVPLYFQSQGDLASTSSLLRGEFAQRLAAGACPSLEIETYTFDVLPEPLRARGVVESVAEEFRWVLREMLGGGGRSGDDK